MFLSNSEHQLWGRYISRDKLNQYRRILESSSNLQQFSVTGNGGDSDDSGNGSSSSTNNTDDEFLLELSTLLFLYQGGSGDSHEEERKGGENINDNIDEDNGRSMRISTIKELRLESFKLTETGWNVLTTVLQSMTNLKTLYLRRVLVVEDRDESDGEDGDNQEEDEEEVVTSIATRSFGSILRVCPRLTQLHLVDCHLDSMAAQAIAQDLTTRTPSLTTLSLEGNSIGNVGVKCLARALRNANSTNIETNNHNCTSACRLMALDIDRVGSSMNDGLSELAEMLKENDSLKSLSCDGNGGLETNAVNERGVHPFEDMLLTNTALKRIQPRFSVVAPKVDFFLRMNRAGRKHVINEGNAMQRCFHLVLKNVADDPAVIFEFLRMQSTLIARQN